MPSSLGPAEILVILVVALIVLGPAKLPQAGRQVGKALAEIRRWTTEVKSEVKGAFDVEEAMNAKPPSYDDYPPYTPPVANPEPARPVDLTKPVRPSTTVMPTDSVLPTDSGMPTASVSPTASASPTESETSSGTPADDRL